MSVDDGSVLSYAVSDAELEHQRRLDDQTPLDTEEAAALTQVDAGVPGLVATTFTDGVYYRVPLPGGNLQALVINGAESAAVLMSGDFTADGLREAVRALEVLAGTVQT